MNWNSITVIVFVILISLMGFESANACNCFPNPSPSQALEQTDVVFSGVVISIETVDRNNHVLIKTKDIWKGPMNSIILVLTPFSQANCGFPFLNNQEFLVYGLVNNDTGRLETHLCTRTRSIVLADEDLRDLGMSSIAPINTSGQAHIYPNPLTEFSVVSFHSIQRQQLKIELFDLRGRRMKTIVEGEFDLGTYQFELDYEGLASGTYVLRLLSDFTNSSSLVTISR